MHKGDYEIAFSDFIDVICSDIRKRQCWASSFSTSVLSCLPNAPVVLEEYHHVPKVRAILGMLDRRTTIMAFIEWTDLHAVTTCCQQSRKLSMVLQKYFESRLFK